MSMKGVAKGALAMQKALASAKADECVRVVVRVRPLSSKEKQDGREASAIPDIPNGTITLANPSAGPGEPPRAFTFDNVYGPTSLQKDIYDQTAAPIVEDVMKGFNGTIFAYGQTGAGKVRTAGTEGHGGRGTGGGTGGGEREGSGGGG